MHILIADAFDAKLPERLAAFGTVSSDMATLAEAHVLLVRSKTKVTPELLAQAPNLKLVIRGGVGMDNVDTAAAQEDSTVNAAAGWSSMPPRPSAIPS